MKLLISLAILTVSIIIACATPDKIPSKTHPEYSGIDLKVLYLYDEYKWLSRQYHVSFSNNVSIGFKNINKGDVVGLCHYGWGWREIDIDINYWNNSTNLQKVALVYHELTHCYCGRDHDYNGKTYEKNAVMEAIKKAIGKLSSNNSESFYDDGCPKSIMYPYVLENYCTNMHYSDYIQEMFKNCKPW